MSLTTVLPPTKAKKNPATITEPAYATHFSCSRSTPRERRKRTTIEASASEEHDRRERHLADRVDGRGDVLEDGECRGFSTSG